MIGPYFEELSRMYPSVQFLKVDVDELPEISNWANVRAMPTFSLYKNGQKAGEVVGANKNTLYELVRKFA